MKKRNDTAIITCSFSYTKYDSQRLSANIKGISNQLSMDINADYYFVELLINNKKTQYPSGLLKKLTYIDIHGSQKNNFLFQKESLLNIGWQRALENHNYDFFIFIDADISSNSSLWLEKIRQKLFHSPDKIVQGFRIIKDIKDPDYLHSSIASIYSLDYQTNYTINPGVCWGIHRSILEKGNGFNPYFIDSCGDSGFVEEYCNTDYYRYEYCHYRYHWFYEIKRDLGFQVKMDCVPIDVFHIFHGNKNSRKNFDNIRFAIDCFNKPLKDIIFINNAGLLEWYNEESLEAKILKPENNMDSKENIFSLFKKMNYNVNLKKPIKPALIDYPDKLFKKYYSNEKITKQLQLKYNLFNPKKIHSLFFAQSFCKNVKTNSEGRCPILKNKNKYSLYLESSDNAEYFELYLPVLPSWEPFDISNYKGINLKVKSLEKNHIFYIQFISRGKNNHNKTSKKFKYNTSICLNKWEHIYLDFSFIKKNIFGFNIKQAIFFKFTGKGSFTIELSEIYFE